MNYRSLGAVFFLGAATAVPAIANTTPSDIVGTWQTEAAAQPTPDGGTAYLRMTTTFSEEKQELLVAVYTDEELRTQIFEYASGGPWEQQGNVEEPAGALAINLVND
ncbi:hypothetical protein [Yoonia vestfoldensis]|uniref:hypothetical protein n=1 Tax=Yoonia vestfoldensis TaxID=245188 RepID=UPI00036F2355|nr:hypothetical protein [Yoonia vestfoldensis]